MTDTRLWNAFRYVSDDPTLDRSQFEADMLQDETLALCVAQVVSEYQLLGRAISPLAAEADSSLGLTQSEDRSIAPVCLPVFPETSTERPAFAWYSIAIAATLFFAIAFVREVRISTSHESRLAGNFSAGSQTNEPAMAERWIQLVSQSSLESDEYHAQAVTLDENFETPVRTNDESDAEESHAGNHDWIIDAARQFYSEGAAG